MYFIMAGDKYVLNPQDYRYQVREASATFTANEASTLTFTVEYNHPLVDELTLFRNDIQLNTGTNIQADGYRYRIIRITRNWDRSVVYDCEEMIASLNDVIVAPLNVSKSGTTCVRDVLQTIIDKYNEEKEAGERFVLGTVTVTDANDYVSRLTETYKSAYEIVKDWTINSQLGGYLVPHYFGNNNITLDYLRELDVADQEVAFSKNLLDLTNELDGTDFYTAIVPLGKDDLTIATKPDKSTGTVHKHGIILENAALVEQFGRIIRVQKWDDVTQVDNLYTKAETLVSNISPIRSIEVSAFDLHWTNDEIDELRCGTLVQVYSEPHGVNYLMIITNKTLDLLRPESTSITFGRNVKTLTSAVVSETGGNAGSPQLSLEMEELHDKTTDVPNVYIDTAGRQVTYNGWSATDFIEIEPSSIYIISSTSQYTCVYDSNKAFIMNTPASIFKPPANAKYIRHSAASAACANWSIVRQYISI